MSLFRYLTLQEFNLAVSPRKVSLEISILILTALEHIVKFIHLFSQLLPFFLKSLNIVVVPLALNLEIFDFLIEHLHLSVLVSFLLS